MTALNNPYQVYRTNQATTSSPGDLTLLLYKGAVRFLKQALRETDKRNWSEVNRLLQRVQDIYQELLITLNTQYELSQSLGSLYDFIIRHLVQANVRKDPRLIQEALDLSEDLLATWEEALKQVKVQRSWSGDLG